MVRSIGAALLALTLATPLGAAELAFVIGNENYRNLTDLRGADDVVSAARQLTEEGVDVISVRDATQADIQDALERFLEAAPDADRVLVVLSGRFVATRGDTYFLPVTTDRTPVLARLPREALPLSVIEAVLREDKNRSVVLLATDDVKDEIGPYLRRGTGPVGASRRTTILRTAPRTAARLVSEVLAEPNQSLLDGIRNMGDVSAPKNLARDYTFVSRKASQDEAEALKAWLEAREADNEEALSGFLQRHPGSRFGSASTRPARPDQARPGTACPADRGRPGPEGRTTARHSARSVHSRLRDARDRRDLRAGHARRDRTMAAGQRPAANQLSVGKPDRTDRASGGCASTGARSRGGGTARAAGIRRPGVVA